MEKKAKTPATEIIKPILIESPIATNSADNELVTIINGAGIKKKVSGLLAKLLSKDPNIKII